jgi:hypothetical protein
MKYIRWPDVLNNVNWFCRHVDDDRAKAFVARTLPTFMLQRHHRLAKPVLIDSVTAVAIAESAVRAKRNSGPLDARDAALTALDEANLSRPFFDFIALGDKSSLFAVGPYVTTADDAARDWLNSIGDRDLDKLPRMTWQQAIRKSEIWHASLRKHAALHAQIAGDGGTADRIESVDGHYWVRLTTRDALDRESAAMGHCVGHGGYDTYVDMRISANGGGIWSLRAQDGRSVLTAEVVRMGHIGGDGDRSYFFVIGSLVRFGNSKLRNDDRRHAEALEDFYANPPS